MIIIGQSVSTVLRAGFCAVIIANYLGAHRYWTLEYTESSKGCPCRYSVLTDGRI
ncbi:hypothetical protein BJX62DRAFT_217026 [Aspergillus germanicus]